MSKNSRKAKVEPIDGATSRYLDGVYAFQEGHGRLPNVNERMAIAKRSERAAKKSIRKSSRRDK